MRAALRNRPEVKKSPHPCPLYVERHHVNAVRWGQPWESRRSVAKQGRLRRPAVDRPPSGPRRPWGAGSHTGLMEISPNSRQSRRAPVAARARIRKDGTSSWTLLSQIGRRYRHRQTEPRRARAAGANVAQAAKRFQGPRATPREAACSRRVFDRRGSHRRLRARARRRTDRRGPSGCGRQPTGKSATSPKPAESSPRPSIGSTRPCWHASGRAVVPRTQTKIPEKQLELQDLVVRRRQLVELRTAEMNRKEHVASKFVKKSLQESVDALNKQIRRFEKRIAALVQSDDEWKQKLEIVQSTPGVGPGPGATLIAEVPGAGAARVDEKSPHWSAWPPSIATAARVPGPGARIRGRPKFGAL